MLSGVSMLEGGFPDYGANYLDGSSYAAAIWSSLYPRDADGDLLDQLKAHDELLAFHRSALRLVSTVADLAGDDLRTGVLPHSEGLRLPGVDPETLRHLWDEHSLRSLSLTWNYETDYAFSCYDSAVAPLKPLGRELVRALATSPLFLDVAHLNEGGFHEVLDLYAPPLLVTHSFCRSIGDHPRGLTDGQLTELGQHGGLVGLAFDPDFLGRGSIDEALRHIDRIADLAGEGAVSIGSDWGVTTMGELGDRVSLIGLLDAVRDGYGQDMAERFAFANAYDFLATHLPDGA
jgi:microsomal dipeptidase-like Zn-dependent dipeptidase